MNTPSIFARRTVRGYEFRQGITSFAHQLADHLDLSGISVEWEQISTAAINGYGVMKLAAVPDDAVIERRTVVRYAGFVVHELLHRKYSNFSTWGENTYLRSLHNAVEDAWIERTAIAAGLTGNIRALLTDLIQQIVDESMVKVADWAAPEVYPFALAVYARGYGVNVPLAEGLEPIFAEASRRIDDCHGTGDTLRVAEWVYDQLQKQQPEQQPEQGKQSDGDADGDQSDGDQSEGDADGEAGEQGSGQEASDQVGKARAPSDSTEAMDVEPTVEGGGGCSFSEHWVTDRDNFHLGARREAPVSVPARLRHEVRRIFDNSGQTLFQRGRLSGSINVGALHQVGTTGRVFQQRRDVEGIDSAVVVCVDCSTSMRQNIGLAGSVAALLIETLQSAQVATSAVAFCDRVSIPVPFGTRVQKARDILSRLTVTGGTNDFAAIRVACDALLSRSEQRRVIFVVTDGEGCKEWAREQIRAARALGIEVIGVGIRHDVADLYGDRTSIRVDAVAELGGAVFSKIKVAA